MDKRVIKVSFDEFLERLHSVENLDLDNTGNHLIDEEFAFAAAGLPSDRDKEIAAHLAGCQSCLNKLTALREAAEQLDTRKLDVWLPALRESFADRNFLLGAVSRASRSVSEALTARLTSWGAWLQSASANPFSTYSWKPAFAGGDLAPDARDSDLDVLLKSPYELCRIEVPARSSINVMVKGEERGLGPVILLQPEAGGEPLIAASVRNPELPFYGARFESVVPGVFLIAMSPYLEEIAN